MNAAAMPDWLHRLIHHLEHILPAQAPIKDFVHHNTLHGFQHLHFRTALAAAEAATGNHGFQSPQEFRAYYAEGRIDPGDLQAALDETPELRADDIVFGGVTRREVLLAGLRFDLKPLPASILQWRCEEAEALTRFQTGVGETARDRVCAGQDAPAALKALWQACAAACRVESRERIEPSPEAMQQRIKLAAERRIAELDAEFGCSLSLRGLLLRLTGRDLMDGLRPYLVRHLAAHLDQGMAAWHNAARSRGFYRAWLESAQRDPHFVINELSGSDQILERLPEDPAECIVQELHVLGLPDDRRSAYLESLAKELPGWSGMFLWRDRHPGYAGEATPVAMLDYLAVRLVLERVYAQQISGIHFKSEASLHGLRGYLHHHPAELLVRLALYHADSGPGMPEWLQEQGHRLVREATNRVGEEDDADWLAVAQLMLSPAAADAEAELHPQRWPLYLLCQHLGIAASELMQAGGAGAQALLDCLAELTPPILGWVWLQAYERHYRQRILAALAANHGRGTWKTRDRRALAQLMLCMDDREEGLRRHLEEISPGVETLGAAAHFNVPHAWLALDETQAVPLAPVVPAVVVPAHEVREKACDAAQYAIHEVRVKQRLQWRSRLHQRTRLGLLAPTLLSLAAAPFTLPLLAGKAFAPAVTGRLVRGLRSRFDTPVQTRIEFVAPNDSPEAKPEARRLGYTDVEQADRVQALLRNTGLTYGFAALVVIMGHASRSQNNPHASAYNCGACAGRWSGPNARLVAAMANRAEVRAILRERGIDLPDDTWFVGSEHDTCDDTVTWYDLTSLPEVLQPALAQLRRDVDEACRRHALERCRRFISAPLDLTPKGALRHIAGRASDWSQARPELGHATNACAFFGRRSLSRGVFLDRRAFLISYDPGQDPDGTVLEQHLVINGAVGAGISLEYYFSAANNERYGCSTKVMHNVAGLLGVMEGASSDLRTGLPRQMIEVHEAMRLLVVVEHRLDVLTDIYRRQPAVRELVGNAWVQLVAIDPDSGAMHRFGVDTGWVRWQAEDGALGQVRCSSDWTRGQRDPLPPVLVQQGLEGA
jgi:uncharacterized protein